MDADSNVVEGNPLRGLMSIKQIADRWEVSRQRVSQVLQAEGVTVWTSAAFGKVALVKEPDVKRVEEERRKRGLQRPGGRRRYRGD